MKKARVTMKIHTIGFTKKSAEQFFEKIRRAGVKRVVDTRLHNTSQLAGFAEKERTFAIFLGKCKLPNIRKNLY